MSVICNKVKERKKTQVTAAAGTHDQPEIVRLVEEAAGGNFDAFGELYNIYLDQIYRYVFYQVNDKMTAEDITEEVFVKAWKAIRSCKGKEKTFLSWLYRIAHNHLITTLRSRKKFTSIEKYNLVEIIDPQIEFEAETEYKELLKKISCLPKNQRQVIILKFIEGLDNREIGKVIGKSEGAIRVSQMRALATLRQKLGNEEVWR
jgi:RNA polymerase sigma-70 factor (ECF subfamily)